MKNMIKAGIATGVLFTLLTLDGCAARVGVYARVAPPPVRYETYGPAPGPGYVWINGYWGWRANNYYWMGGRWDRAPQGRRRWEDGRWEHRGGGYVWRDGRWH